ncbi:hypothetical protein ACIRU3_29320 [Streptomyces sp. NPDC101151]|uniref:hypothetical protein n=1 Tax=Streptomyces sp. NPDC101151 TaxID=3366115 RepID=UPI0037FAE9C3
MDEYVTPTGPEVPARDMVLWNWAATVDALPVGTRITGKVVSRQPFGIFIRIQGVPDALGLAEITAMPLGMKLPALGATVTGVVHWLDPRNQVRVRLDE